MIQVDSNGDDVEDNQEIIYNLDTFVAEDLKQCLDLVEDLSLVVEDNNSNIEQKIEIICEKFDGLINKWQTNPKLIESHLKELLDPIIDIITKSEVNGKKFNTTFHLIQRLVSCIGPKAVSRYFPTEVFWLTKLIEWCERQTPGDSNSWRTRSVLLLWLSMSVKTPFHLRKFDSNESERQDTVSQRIYCLIDIYLKVSDKSRDSAAILAANFFSRPDIIQLQLLTRFMEDSFIQMNSNMGHVIAMAVLFKVAKRTDISVFSEQVIEKSSKIDTGSHELIAKWKIKLIGRSALSLMTPRIAKWRYQRGRRLLSQNIIQIPEPLNQMKSIETISFEDNEDDCDYNDIPEQIELIIDSLLNGLHDPNTIVRWSAAKYVSRLTNRLPKELAADVVTHVLQLSQWKRSESSWHGCCLALAELSRRGLVLPNQLPQIVALIEKALIFDELKGTFSVGANVRDAACFVCWSLSRAYESDEIQKFVHKLAPILVCVTCFDREVNCRRAASAAIQEMVGRTQVFPHGLEVLVLTDFHSLAKRSHSYLEIALSLCQKQEFGESLFEHLIWKCCHWDRDIRELAAQSMGRLSAHIDINPYFNELLSKSTSLDLNSRHGSILSIAYIIGEIGPKIKPEFIEGIESIASDLIEKKLLRGMGGEFMKQALSILIEKCSSIALPIDSNVFSVWIELVCDSISSEDLKTRKDAISCVPIFCRTYLQNEAQLKERVLTQLLRHLTSSKESSRIGSSESLRLMSKEILSVEYFNHCFDAMVSHIQSGDLLCNSRASEVLALIDLSLKFSPFEDLKQKTIFECLCMALDDRSIDSRGDIGGNVRLAAIEASLRFVEHLDEKQTIKILKLMSTQCVSVWLKERKSAVKAFKQIVFSRDLDQIDRHLIKSFFDDNSEESQWQPFIHLLRVEVFTYDLWRGLIKCVANPTEVRVRNLLKHELKSTQNHVYKQFLVLYENNVSNELLSQSCINCSHFLLSSCRTSEEFCKKVLTLTWSCIRRSRDCRKIVSAIDVFCTGFQFSVFKQSISYLSILLCHSIPRIRCQTANQMYVGLITLDNTDEDVTNLLSDTDWTQPLQQLRPIRDQICDALGVAKPVKVTTSGVQQLL